jgi:lysylphosphatidylglycerol synthetase-like protein (DUF2156 family)
MSTEHAQHLEPSLTKQADTDPGAHDHATEVRHAWHHFRENAYFFAGFLSLILAAVVQFESSGQTNYYWIFALGAARFALIAFFMFSLVRPFSLVVATFLFTILFFGGMVYLSIWDSQLPYLGNPIPVHDHVSSAHS